MCADACGDTRCPRPGQSISGNHLPAALILRTPSTTSPLLLRTRMRRQDSSAAMVRRVLLLLRLRLRLVLLQVTPTCRRAR
jgi:hypothetical protein